VNSTIRKDFLKSLPYLLLTDIVLPDIDIAIDTVLDTVWRSFQRLPLDLSFAMELVQAQRFQNSPDCYPNTSAPPMSPERTAEHKSAGDKLAPETAEYSR
jgi:hypothetical protein